jgi:DNA-binding transcriptional LysR family regulator
VLAVAEYRSFIAAAASLKMSQPALTRSIKQIEATIGVALFARTTREVSVTDAGKEFAALAERLLNDMKIGINSVREQANQLRGQIIVASVLSLANIVLPSLIADYSRRFRGIEIHLREGLQGNVRDDVRSGLADFGVSYLAELPNVFETEAIGVENFYVVLPAGHRLARKRTIELKELKDTTLVSFPADSHTRRLADSAAAAAGFAFRHTITANRLATLYGLVRNGVGLTIVAASERPASDDAVLASRRLAGPRLSCEIGIIRLRERELTPAAAHLLTVVKKGLRAVR